MIDIEREFFNRFKEKVEVLGTEYQALAIVQSLDPDRYDELLNNFCFEQVERGYWIKVADDHYEDRTEYELEFGREPLDFTGATEGDR